MVEENVHIIFFESIPDMELGMDGGIEKEGINISPPFQPKQMDILAKCNLKTQKSWVSNDSGVIDKEDCTR